MNYITSFHGSSARFSRRSHNPVLGAIAYMWMNGGQFPRTGGNTVSCTR